VGRYGGSGSNQGPNSTVSAPSFQQAWPPNFSLLSPKLPPTTSVPALVSGAADYTTDLTVLSSLPAGLSLAQAGTTTYFNSSGVMATATANTPRFAYKYNGTSWVAQGLLVEGVPSNNMLLQSGSFSANWNGSDSGWTANATTSPDGTTNAFSHNETFTGSTHYEVYQQVTPTTSGTWTFSVYLKPNVRPWAYFEIHDSGGSVKGAYFDITNGAVGTIVGANITTGIENVGSGWYRCWATETDITTSGLWFGWGPAMADGSVIQPNYSGTNGTSALYFAFPQMEATGAPSSYINTTTATVTRAADALTASGTLATLLSGASASAVLKTSIIGRGTNGRLLGDTAGNESPMFVSSNTVAGIYTDQVNTSATATLGSSGTYLNTDALTGSGWDFGSSSLVADGGTVADFPYGLALGSGTYFFRDAAGTAAVNGYLKSISAWGGRLSDADLITATTLPSNNGVGSSAGTNTATAVGAWIQAGVGSSAGSNTATAVGAWLQSGVGSSAGANTTTAVGHWLQSGDGVSAGVNTATATGAWLQSGVGSSAGTNTSDAPAAPIQAKVGTAAGSNTATAVGAWLQSGVGSAAGANTATATGRWLQSSIGASSGANTATATGAWLQSGVGSSAGANTTTGTGAWLQSGVGSSAGANTSSATGAKLQAGVGNAAGDNIAAGFAVAGAGTGTAAGTNTATAVGQWLYSAVGLSAGGNTSSGTGRWLYPAVGLSVGGNVAEGFFFSTSIVEGVGLSVGGNIAQAVSSGVIEADFSSDFGADFSGYPGHGVGTSADFNSDFNDDFATYGIQIVVSGTGFSAGGNIASAVSSTIVVEPPVYPPPPPVVHVWIPQHEYHRVQEPIAHRIYSKGISAKRKTPQGMKRQYG
jgi:hypothetical protein